MDAVFAAKSGDIVGPVEAEFGYHVLGVTGIVVGAKVFSRKGADKDDRTRDLAAPIVAHALWNLVTAGALLTVFG